MVAKVNRFPSVRTTDLVRVKINGKWVSVHKHWYTSYPWKTYDSDGDRKPKAALNGGGE